MPDHEHTHDDNPLQGYFDWQVTTIMLARDLVDPLPGNDEQAHHQRRHQIEDEVRQFSLNAIPDEYKNNPNLDWPSDVMMALTRATFEHVNAILRGQ